MARTYLLALGILACVALPIACDSSSPRLTREEAAVLTGGAPERGRVAIEQYGCGSCHTIAGVPGANSLVGPPLTGIASRAFIAGVLPNTAPNMIRWIQNPQAVNPLTAMPNLGVPESTARDIAGYLYSLK